MNPARLIVILLALVILGTGAFLLFGSEPEAPVTITGNGDADDGDPNTSAANADEPEREPTTGDSNNQRESVVSGTTERELSPEIRAALTGFRGRIVLPDGEPIQQCRVELFRFGADSVMTPAVAPMLGDARFEPDVDAGDTKTDASGKFEITGVWPRGFYLLRAGYGTDDPTLRIVDQIPGPGEIVDLGDIVVQPSGILTGIVLGDDGKPLANALVRAADIPGEFLQFAPIHQFDPEGGLIISEGGNTMVAVCPDWVKRRFDMLPIPMTRTGEDGAFRLTGVAPGSNVFTVNAKGLLAQIKSGVRVKPGEEKDLGEIRMREGETLYGRVVDLEGKGIEGAEVFAASSGSIPVNFARFTPPTNSKGEFELSGFANQNVIVAARRTSGDPWHVIDPQPIIRDIEIQLPSTYELKISVVSEAGREIENPQFQLNPGELNRGAIEMAMWGASQPVDIESRLDKLEDGTFVVRDVPAGEFALLARADGHAIGAVQVKMDGDTEVTVKLTANAAFDVEVREAGGAPIADAVIYVEARGERPRLPSMPVCAGETDEDGALYVDVISAKSARVTAYHPAYGNAHAELVIPSPQPIVLRMEQPGTLIGTLTENGQKPTPGKWTLMIEREWDSNDRGAMPDIPTMVVPDLEGEFRASGLRPGKYEVRPIESIAALTSPGKLFDLMQMSRMTSSPNESTVDVTSGTETRVLLDTVPKPEDLGPSGQVTGLILLDGLPAAELSVMTWGNGNRKAVTTDASGRFDLGQIKVGNQNVQVYEIPKQGGFQMRRNAVWSGNVEVKENEIHDLTIDVKLSSMSGFVSRADGSAAEGCRVNISGKSEAGRSRTWFQATTDANGKFEFERLPTGTYSVTAQDDTHKAERSGIKVEHGVSTAGIRLTMVRMVRVTGTLDLTAFGEGKTEWMWLQFRKLDENGKNTGNNEWVQIDKTSGAFETNELDPGTYEIRVNGPQAEPKHYWGAESTVIIGTTDMEGISIRPVQKLRASIPARSKN